MRYRRRPPTKVESIGGIIGGVIFILIGVTIAIPTFGLFGIFWTLMAVVITGVHTFSVLSNKGQSDYRSDSGLDSPKIEHESFDVKLRKLEKIKREGLINEKEYQRKRKEILKQRW